MEFLPLEEICKRITIDNVRAELSISRPEALWKYRNLLETVCHRAKKVFAILVLIQESWAIKGLIDEGIDDTHLPLSRKAGVDTDNADYNVLLSACGTKAFQSFASWNKEEDVNSFLSKQWLVQAPVFKLDTSDKPILLDRNCPLPFSIIPGIAEGGAGLVYHATLHQAHQQGFEGVRTARANSVTLCTLVLRNL